VKLVGLIHFCIGQVNTLYCPVIPEKSEQVQEALNACKKAIIFPKLELKEIEKSQNELDETDLV